MDKNLRNVDNVLTGLILFEVITGFGTSTANLRALGSANTLVLINGRRIAGRAGDEEGFANLLNVPLSAIERVDVQLDGGSAVYGADAIGGVINFITKKNYTGATVSLRQDVSSTGADRTNANIQGGYGWGSGQISGTLQRTSQEPIINAKTGWTTKDYRACSARSSMIAIPRPASRASYGRCVLILGALRHVATRFSFARGTAARAQPPTITQPTSFLSITCRRKMARMPPILR